MNVRRYPNDMKADVSIVYYSLELCSCDLISRVEWLHRQHQALLFVYLIRARTDERMSRFGLLHGGGWRVIEGM